MSHLYDMRGHPGLNWGPFDLQSNALPLSYTPITCTGHFDIAAVAPVEYSHTSG
jgi:hypothetical protein